MCFTCRGTNHMFYMSGDKSELNVSKHLSFFLHQVRREADRLAAERDRVRCFESIWENWRIWEKSKKIKSSIFFKYIFLPLLQLWYFANNHNSRQENEMLRLEVGALRSSLLHQRGNAQKVRDLRRDKIKLMREFDFVVIVISPGDGQPWRPDREELWDHQQLLHVPWMPFWEGSWRWQQCQSNDDRVENYNECISQYSTTNQSRQHGLILSHYYEFN